MRKTEYIIKNEALKASFFNNKSLNKNLPHISVLVKTIMWLFKFHNFFNHSFTMGGKYY